MNNKIEKALEFATQANKGQLRKGGQPYIVHPIRVAENVKRFKESSELDMLIAAAYLHDTIEDTDRLDNVIDLKNCNKEFRNKYIDETNDILDYLEKNRELSKTHKTIINEIKNELNKY